MMRKAGCYNSCGIDSRDLPLTAHLTELRRRILICIIPFIPLFCIMFVFSENILRILMIPVKEGRCELFLYQITDAFTIRFRIAFYAALISEFPLIVAEAAYFMSPGLYPKERRQLILLSILVGFGMATGSFLFAVRGAQLITMFWCRNGMHYPVSLSAASYFQMWLAGAAAAGLLCSLPAAFFVWITVKSRRKMNDQT